MDPLTYRAAGVDIQAGDLAVRRIAPLAASTRRPEVLGGLGAFAAFCRVPAGYREPVLVSSTDGVGTKLKIAIMADRHDTVGLDLVAMGVNDLLVHGAEPLFFLDYLAVHRVDPDQIETIVAGFAVGVAEQSLIITGDDVAIGDRVLGLASSGLHSNGYTLAREAIFGRMGLKLNDPIPGVGRPVVDELLEPTRIYVRPVLSLLREVTVKAMAHVTGGGITENLPRVLPAGRRARLTLSTWPVPPVFAAIQRAASVDDAEMRRTFNMGLVFLLVVAADDVGAATQRLATAGERVFTVGEIVAGDPGVDYA